MLKTLTLVAALGLSTAIAHAQDPQSGGTLNFTAPYGSAFSTLDSHASPRAQDRFIPTAVHRSLYSWDAVENQPRLELAESVDVSDDGMVYTYHLRQNAVFHHGKPLTADDIIATYERIALRENALPGARYIEIIEGAREFGEGDADTISGLKKIDEHTLEMTLGENINPGFSLMETTTSIYPSDIDFDEQGITPTGLGPFKFVQHVPGSEAVFERFDDYYEDGKPYLDQVRIILMADGAARDVAFRNQEIDISILGPVQYQAYMQDAGLKENVLEVAENFTRHMGFDLEYEPFQDKRVRQAINHALDSGLIIERLARGKGVQAVSWLPVASPAFDDTAEPYEYNPDRARELLAEAGYEDGFSFEVKAEPNESYGLTIVEAILPMLAQVGIEIVPRPIEAATTTEVLASGDFQAYMFSLSTGPDPLTAMRCFYSRTERSSCNYTGFANEEFDRLFEAALTETDADTQADLLREANNLVQDEAPMWFYNYNKAALAFQPWVHGVVPNATEMAVQPFEDIWIDDNAPSSRK